MKRSRWLGSSLAILGAALALSACGSEDVIAETAGNAGAAGNSTAGSGGGGGAGGVNTGGSDSGTGGDATAPVDGGTGGVNAGGSDSGTGGDATAPVDGGTGGDATAPVDSGTGGDATAPVDGGTGGDATAPVDGGKGGDATAPVDGGKGGDATAQVEAGPDGSVGACVFPPFPACTALTPIALADACTKYGDALCALYKRCGLIGDAEIADCKAQFVASCNLPTGDAGTGPVTYDGAKAACCIKHITDDYACNALNVDMNRDPACNEAWVGTVAISGACYGDGECAGNAFCDTGSACPGTCKTYIAIGSPCASGDQCADNGKCLAGADGGATCVATSYSCQDAPCTKYGRECFTGYYCKLPAADAGAGTCQALPSSGEACGPETSYQCATGLACNINLEAGFTGTCGTPGTAGASCLATMSCAAGFYCVKPDGGVLGTCTAVLATGTGCDPNTNDFSCGRAIHKCQPGTSTCGVDPVLSEPCSPLDDNCQNGWCDGSGSDASLGVCVAKLAGGAACTDNRQCASGDCTTTADGGGVCKNDCKRP
jgi:hypothetical protein